MTPPRFDPIRRRLRWRYVIGVLSGAAFATIYLPLALWSDPPIWAFIVPFPLMMLGLLGLWWVSYSWNSIVSLELPMAATGRDLKVVPTWSQRVKYVWSFQAKGEDAQRVLETWFGEGVELPTFRPMRWLQWTGMVVVVPMLLPLLWLDFDDWTLYAYLVGMMFFAMGVLFPLGLWFGAWQHLQAWERAGDAAA